MHYVALLDGLPNHLHPLFNSRTECGGYAFTIHAIHDPDGLFEFSTRTRTARAVHASDPTYTRWDGIRFTEPFHSGVIVSQTHRILRPGKNASLPRSPPLPFLGSRRSR